MSGWWVGTSRVNEDCETTHHEVEWLENDMIDFLSFVRTSTTISITGVVALAACRCVAPLTWWGWSASDGTRPPPARARPFAIVHSRGRGVVNHDYIIS